MSIDNEAREEAYQDWVNERRHTLYRGYIEECNEFFDWLECLTSGFIRNHVHSGIYGLYEAFTEVYSKPFDSYCRDKWVDYQEGMASMEPPDSDDR